MKLDQLKNKKILIIGFGTEGNATYDFLKHFFPNQTIDAADQKDGNDYLDQQKNYDVVIKSPGIQKEKITIPYTTATNIFFANVKGLTIGITGSKGKSTTSSLLYGILKQAGKKAHLVGNITHKLDPIGSPMLKELLASNEADDIWVCELSSFMLDDIQYSPHIVVMTSFFPEHMDYHGSIEKYWSAKKNILSQVKETDYFVYNPTFEELETLAKTTRAKTIPFISELPFSHDIIPLIGEHNIDNVKAAVSVAQLLHISDQDSLSAVKNFIPLPHRLENIGTFHKITFYDDAIATTPEATIQAIKTLQHIGTIFLGGQDRGFDFRELAKIIVAYDIPNLVLFPESGEKIFQSIQSISDKHYNILKTDDMKEAVKFAYAHSPKGSIALLSSAAPSYTVWNNFEEKGNLFKKFVKELGNT